MNAQSTIRPLCPLGLLRRPLAAALILLLAPTAFAQKLPSGFTNNIYGAVGSPVTSGQTMTITQTSPGAIIQWSSFNIASGYAVNFLQPSATSVVLNRVTGAGASEIDGMLSANGRVFVINPNGVLFGNGAQVSVGGLVASTLGISNTNFNYGVASGTFVFTGSTGSSGISNLGSLTAAAGGTIAFLSADNISNSGTINAPSGNVALGWGRALTLDIGGDGLTNLVIALHGGGQGSASIVNTGTLQADGGQVVMRADMGDIGGVVNQDGIVQAHSLWNHGGQIVLDAGGNELEVTGSNDASASGAGVAGGLIDFDGSNILLGANSLLDTNGNGGGQVSVDATGVLAMAGGGTISANALGAGNGGSIMLDGASGLYAYGALSATGGSNSGNGGLIETSGSGVDLDGIRINASAMHGTAGLWLIDPYNVLIVHGDASGSLPTNPFVPTSTSTIDDGDINNALNGGTSVTITTGTNGKFVGNVIFNSVDIARTTGTAPLTFTIDANASIFDPGTAGTIESIDGAGPLNIVFNSNANSVYNGDPDNGYIALNGMDLLTNGGNVSMYGQSNPASGFASSSQIGIQFYDGLIDTRIDQENTQAGGSVMMRGVANDSVLGVAGVDISGSSITTSTGAISLFGSVLTGDGAGVSLSDMEVGNAFVGTQLSTTSGNITLDGTSLQANDEAAKWGVYMTDTDITTQSGNIAIIGRAEGTPDAGFVSNGVEIGANTTIFNGSGSTLIAGEATSGAAGVEIDAGASVNGGSGNVVVEASNDDTGDALILNGTLANTGTIDLRPGGVDVNGNVTEDPNDAINLGGTLGFGISATDLANISTSNLVLGSNIQTGAITVSAPITFDHNLTLDSGAGGGIAVDGALNLGANTLALISAGNITQTAPITAASLLVQSSAGLVNLDNAGNNLSSTTLAGSANGDFTFVNAGTVGIGDVTATGFSAAGNTSTLLSGSGISGGDILVRALTGNMILDAGVSGSNVDLVDAGIFDNAGGDTITATGDWRVWSNTWVGETRGGVAGSGTLPNLYGCAFGADCTVTPSTSANQFIYVNRPVVTVDLADSTRQYGLPNATINYSVNGLILGDLAAYAINGSIFTDATQASNVGNYAINGSFISPAGYLVNVIPGALSITPAILTYFANAFSRIYGDPNGALDGTVTGFRLSDTLANSTTGTLIFGTSATQGSNVGTYAIDGSGLSATNYVFVQAAGNNTSLTIDPATLTYIADPLQRLVGMPNGLLGGSVTGFVNGDTLATATTGTLNFQSPAGTYSPVGTYGIFGTGLSATNYVFVQANGNATALLIAPQLDTYTLDVMRDEPVTYVYDSNFGMVGLCPAPDLVAGSREQEGDTLARQWSRVRSRPNLANCISTKQKSSCGDF
jgi:filamentous hemagglutinin family protein